MSSFIAEKLDIAIKTDYAAISREYFPKAIFIPRE